MKKLELLGAAICLYVHYDDDLVRHSLRRFKYYLSKIKSYKRVGIDAKKLSMSNLVDFSKALRVAILLCEDTLDAF